MSQHLQTLIRVLFICSCNNFISIIWCCSEGLHTTLHCCCFTHFQRFRMSTHAPYATMHDLPKYEKRADAVGAPWFKDQEAVKCSRGHDPLPYIACNSRTAPFATFHNIPETAEHSAPLPAPSVEQDLFVQQPLHPINGSQLPSEPKHSKPCDTSGDHGHHGTQPNMLMVHQAPWDRDEVHHKVQQRFPHGEDAPHYTSSHAPYATDSKR